MTNPPAEPGAMPKVLRCSVCQSPRTDGDPNWLAWPSRHSDKQGCIDALLSRLTWATTGETDALTQLAHLRAEGAKDRERLARILAFHHEECTASMEAGPPNDCGPVEYEGAECYLCAKHWPEYLASLPDNERALFINASRQTADGGKQE